MCFDHLVLRISWTLINKLTSVFLCVCPLIDEYFRHKIIKIAVERLNHFLFNRPLTKAAHKVIRSNIAVLERDATKFPNVQGMSRILNSKLPQKGIYIYIYIYICIYSISISNLLTKSLSMFSDHLSLPPSLSFSVRASGTRMCLMWRGFGWSIFNNKSAIKRSCIIQR